MSTRNKLRNLSVWWRLYTVNRRPLSVVDWLLILWALLAVVLIYSVMAMRDAQAETAKAVAAVSYNATTIAFYEQCKPITGYETRVRVGVPCMKHQIKGPTGG